MNFRPIGIKYLSLVWRDHPFNQSEARVTHWVYFNILYYHRHHNNNGLIKAKFLFVKYVKNLCFALVHLKLLFVILFGRTEKWFCMAFSLQYFSYHCFISHRILSWQFYVDWEIDFCHVKHLISLVHFFVSQTWCRLTTLRCTAGWPLSPHLTGQSCTNSLFHPHSSRYGLDRDREREQK